MRLLPDGDERIYTTRKQHGRHPPGSLCIAWREGGRLKLEFTDGEVLDGRGHLQGIEEVGAEEAEQMERTYLRVVHGVYFCGDP